MPLAKRETMMTKKAIISWISIVSGLITILVVFDNPFEDKAELYAYVENQETLHMWRTTEDVIKYDTDYSLKLTLKNVGELVAKDVHIKAKDASGFAVIKQNDKYVKVDDSSSIYIDRLEAGTDVELYLWGSFYRVSHYGIDDDFSISSPDSGKAIIRGDIKGDNIIWFVEKYFIFIVAFLFTAPLLLLSIFGQDKKTSEGGDDKSQVSDFESSMEKLNYAWSIGLISEKEFKARGREILDSSLPKE